eukprot:2641700-Rhodomonas_salina.1
MAMRSGHALSASAAFHGNASVTSKSRYSHVIVTLPSRGQVLGEKTMMKRSCGTWAYWAPEILRRQLYDYSVDLWYCFEIVQYKYCPNRRTGRLRSFAASPTTATSTTGTSAARAVLQKS